MSDPSSREMRTALDRLVRRARASAAPELDWERVEAGLMQQVSQRAPLEQRRPRLVLWGSLAAAAAALALWAGSHSFARPTLQSPKLATTERSHMVDGDALAPGSHVTAVDKDVVVEHAGRARWTLAPHSRAQLGERDAHIAVRLEVGSVASNVVPSLRRETFVVEAANVRVAVHGTAFRVALEGGRVMVDVSEGVVGVGPLGAPAAHFVKAGSHAEFSSDGQSGTLDGAPLGAVAGRPESATKWSRPSPPLAPAAAEASMARPAAPLPVEPAINDIEMGVAPIVSATSECFATHTHSSDDVKITVRTAVSLRILDSGEVAEVDFQPPLAPEVEECARPRLLRVRFAPSQRGTKVTRLLELSR
jgi:ferric-dicitrate binding protein FerR (iron transport regulator)